MEEQVRETAGTPEDLGRLFVARARQGDVDGVAALYEPDAVLELRDGTTAVGDVAIRAAYTRLFAVRSDFSIVAQPPALISGDLALTSSRTPGAVTAEVARRRPDGTWRWILDRPDVTR
jgi:ketosteroid isomerase-like protein